MAVLDNTFMVGVSAGQQPVSKLRTQGNMDRPFHALRKEQCNRDASFRICAEFENDPVGRC
jgi:hypothetical protein